MLWIIEKCAENDPDLGRSGLINKKRGRQCGLDGQRKKMAKIAKSWSFLEKESLRKITEMRERSRCNEIATFLKGKFCASFKLLSIPINFSFIQSAMFLPLIFKVNAFPRTLLSQKQLFSFIEDSIKYDIRQKDVLFITK